MDIKKAALKTLAEAVDLKKLGHGLIDNVLEEALKKVVADSENTFDDMAMAALWPVLEKEVKAIIDEELDLAKILKLDEMAQPQEVQG